MNMCHKAPMKRTPLPQKKGTVISVVTQKKEAEVSLAVISQREEADVVAERVLEKKSRSRSRSRKRSRSRARAKARALSSPPQVSGSQCLAIQQSADDDLKLEVCSAQLEKEGVQVLTSGSEVEMVDEGGQYQFEEGEIREVEAVEVSKGARGNQESSVAPVVEEAVWFTKHSKHYRRALRQHERWKASGAKGSPPKSSKFLFQANSLGKELAFDQ